MDQHIAVKKMMLDVKLYEQVPPELYPLIRNYLKQMWCVGYDHCRQTLFNSRTKTICQYNKDMKLINTFRSVVDAEKRTGIPAGTIESCATKGFLNRKKFYWKYVNDKQPEQANRDHLMY